MGQRGAGGPAVRVGTRPPECAPGSAKPCILGVVFFLLGGQMGLPGQVSLRGLWEGGRLALCPVAASGGALWPQGFPWSRADPRPSYQSAVWAPLWLGSFCPGTGHLSSSLSQGLCPLRASWCVPEGDQVLGEG